MTLRYIDPVVQTSALFQQQKIRLTVHLFCVDVTLYIHVHVYIIIVEHDAQYLCFKDYDY